CADMAARLRGLSSFYGGPFWQARRDAANAMMLEHHNVHLLRPLAPITALTGRATPEEHASEPPGDLPARTGLVAVDFYRTAPEAVEDLVDRFERKLRPVLAASGHQVLGHFVAELAPNDYPRLPVIQDPSLLIVLSAYRDRSHSTIARRDWTARGPVVAGGLERLLTADVATI